MRALVGLWRGLFYRTYIARYLELHPAVTQEEVRAWMIPVAADRLNEHIAGEEESLLHMIRSYLPCSSLLESRTVPLWLTSPGQGEWP